MTLKNSRKLKKNKEKLNGLQKEYMGNLLEIWIRLRPTQGNVYEKKRFERMHGGFDM